MAWFWLTGTRTGSSYPVNPGNRTTLGETLGCGGGHHVSPLSLSLTWGGLADSLWLGLLVCFKRVKDTKQMMVNNSVGWVSFFKNENSRFQFFPTLERIDSIF
jgi:hypothetical protein